MSTGDIQVWSDNIKLLFNAMPFLQEERERLEKQNAQLQKLKNEIRPAFAIKGKRKVGILKKRMVQSLTLKQNVF